MSIEKQVVEQLKKQNQSTDELAKNIGVTNADIIPVVGKLGEQRVIGMDMISMKWQLT